MSLKCTNPACGADFQIRRGRLFHVKHPNGKGVHCVEHFWLCDMCSKSFTVQWRDGGLLLRTIHAPSARAANRG